jgi:hypothetical protein
MFDSRENKWPTTELIVTDKLVITYTVLIWIYACTPQPQGVHHPCLPWLVSALSESGVVESIAYFQGHDLEFRQACHFLFVLSSSGPPILLSFPKLIIKTDNSVSIN